MDNSWYAGMVVVAQMNRDGSHAVGMVQNELSKLENEGEREVHVEKSWESEAVIEKGGTAGKQRGGEDDIVT